MSDKIHLDSHITDETLLDQHSVESGAANGDSANKMDYRILVQLAPDSLAKLTGRPSSHISWPDKLKNWITLFERVAITLILFVVIFALAYVSWQEIFKKTLVIEPFEVPEEIAKSSGLTGRTLAQMLRGEITRIQEESKTLMETGRVKTDWEDATVKVAVPGAGVDLDTILRYFRQNERRVSGSLIVGNCSENEPGSACLYVQVRGRSGNLSKPVHLTNLRDAIKTSAIYVFRNYEDYFYAASLIDNDLEAAKKEMHGILDGKYIGDRAFAANGLGYICDIIENNNIEALKWYNRANSISPEFAMADLNRCTVLHDLDRYEEALAAFDLALDINPEYVFAHNNRGIALKKLGQNEEALAAYNVALELDPEHNEAHDNRARLLEEMGR